MRQDPKPNDSGFSTDLLALDTQAGDIDGAAIGVNEFQAQGVRARSGRERSVHCGTGFGGDMAFTTGEELLAGQRLPFSFVLFSKIPFPTDEK
jgi:hypothetical protein